MNAISRPEYYVVPTRHPGNCRCSEHRGTVSQRAPSIVHLPEKRRRRDMAPWFKHSVGPAGD